MAILQYIRINDYQRQLQKQILKRTCKPHRSLYDKLSCTTLPGCFFSSINIPTVLIVFKENTFKESFSGFPFSTLIETRVFLFTLEGLYWICWSFHSKNNLQCEISVKWMIVNKHAKSNKLNEHDLLHKRLDSLLLVFFLFLLLHHLLSIFLRS